MQNSEFRIQKLHCSAALLAVLASFAPASSAFEQAVGGAEKARPVAGDTGISTMVVVDAPDFRVLRDYAEPGTTREGKEITSSMEVSGLA